MKADFATLYAELGVDPGCDLDEFRQAYRRRLSSLHPDRVGDLRARQGRLSLQQLKQVYEQSMEFHRQYGRLPGSRATGQSAPAFMASTVPPLATPHQSRVVVAPPQAKRRSPLRMLVLTALIVTIAAAYYVNLPEAERTSQPLATGSRNGDGLEAAPSSASRPMLHTGMTKSEVLAIEGRPIETRGEHWWYGPSWLRFEDEQLVAWYSSPLRPLHTAEQVTGNQRP